MDDKKSALIPPKKVDTYKHPETGDLHVANFHTRYESHLYYFLIKKNLSPRRLKPGTDGL